MALSQRGNGAHARRDQECHRLAEAHVWIWILDRWQSGCLPRARNRLVSTHMDLCFGCLLPCGIFLSTQLKGLDATDTIRLHHNLHLLERRLVDLRYAALVDSEQAADFLHRHLVGIVQQDDLLIALW